MNVAHVCAALILSLARQAHGGMEQDFFLRIGKTRWLELRKNGQSLP